MKNKSSIFAAAKEKFVALRKKWGIENRYSMAEIAQKSGLLVEYLKNAPRNFTGFLDWHDEPRFIAVNPELPPHEQVLFIARQLALRAHQRRYNSMVLDRPWKWKMLDAAPEPLRNKICQLDVEYRAHWLMLFFASGDEFRAFTRANPKRFWAQLFTSDIVGWHLGLLRVKICFGNVLRALAIA